MGFEIKPVTPISGNGGLIPPNPENYKFLNSKNPYSYYTPIDLNTKQYENLIYCEYNKNEQIEPACIWVVNPEKDISKFEQYPLILWKFKQLQDIYQNSEIPYKYKKISYYWNELNPLNHYPILEHWKEITTVPLAFRYHWIDLDFHKPYYKGIIREKKRQKRTEPKPDHGTPELGKLSLDYENLANREFLNEYKLKLLNEIGKFSVNAPEHYITPDIHFSKGMSPFNYQSWNAPILRKVAKNVVYSNEKNPLFTDKELFNASKYERLDNGIGNLLIESFGFKLRIEPELDQFRLNTIGKLMVLEQLAMQYISLTKNKFLALRKFDLEKQYYIDNELIKIIYTTRFSPEYIERLNSDIKTIYQAIFSLYNHFYFMTLTIKPYNLTIGNAYQEIQGYFNKINTRIKNQIKRYVKQVKKKKKELPKTKFLEWVSKTFYSENSKTVIGLDPIVLYGDIEIFHFHIVEFQENGFPHLHILYAGIRWIDLEWLRKTMEFQENMLNVYVSYSKNFKQAMKYMVKYITKTIGDIVNPKEKDWNWYSRILSWSLNAKIMNTSNITMAMIDRLFYEFYTTTNMKYKKLLFFALSKITTRIEHKIRNWELQLAKLRYCPYSRFEQFKLMFMVYAPDFDSKITELENKVIEYREYNNKIKQAISTDWDMINKLNLNTHKIISNTFYHEIKWVKIGIYEIDNLYDQINTLNDLLEHYYNEITMDYG